MAFCDDAYSYGLHLNALVERVFCDVRMCAQICAVPPQFCREGQRNRPMIAVGNNRRFGVARRNEDNFGQSCAPRDRIDNSHDPLAMRAGRSWSRRENIGHGRDPKVLAKLLSPATTIDDINMPISLRPKGRYA